MTLRQEIMQARKGGASREVVLSNVQDYLDEADDVIASAEVRDDILGRVTGEGCPFIEVETVSPDSFRVLQDVDNGVWWRVTVEREKEVAS